MNPHFYVFIGSYTDANTPGIYTCVFHESDGRLSLKDSVGGLGNPTFLEINEPQSILYAIADEPNDQGGKSGLVASYRIDPATGSLTLMDKQPSLRSPTCHIALDRSHRCLIVSSYHGGMIGLLPVEQNGQVGPVADLHQHKGSSILPVQNQARAHSTFLDRNNRFAVTCDLGLDKIVIYQLDSQRRKLIPHGEVNVSPGAGPRHFAFHPSLPYGYVINELDSSVTAFQYNSETGTLTDMQTISTLPDTYTLANACADIHISPDGRFLYGSNRGHDSITVYGIDSATGKLSLIEHTSSGGGHPRNFALSPDGRFLLVANRDANNIVTFARNETTGKLTATGAELSIPKPVCVKFSPYQDSH